MAITNEIKEYQKATAERNQQIIDLFDSSLTATKVAEQCDATVDIVQRVWNKAFDKETRAKRKARVRKAQSSKKATRSDKDSVKALELFDSDLTAIEVAKQCGYNSSGGILRLWQSHFGKEKCKERATRIKRIVHDRNAAEKRQEVETLLRDPELSARQVATETGLCFETVRKISNQVGIDLTKKKLLRLEEKNKEALNLFYSNLSAGKVSEKVGVSRLAVLSLWQRYYGKEETQKRSDDHRPQVTEEDIEQMRTKLAEEGYQLELSIDTYKDSFASIIIVCPKGSRYETKWHLLRGGNRCGCGKCFQQQSKAEREIIRMYKDKANLIEQDRTILDGKELDIYFPDHNLAIEYCGLYWHSTSGPNERITPSYHRDKMDKCQSQDIRLLTIFEDEWLNHKDVCISRINNALGLTSNKIYARKCEVKEITKEEAKEFLNRTHLQGYGGSKVAYGLFYNDELIQVMTFAHPSRAHTAKGKKVLEMKRLAAEPSIVVVGGAGKLFKLGIRYAQSNNYDLIKSYCDLRWGTGNLYEKLGFTKTYDSKYTLHYTDGYKRWRNQRLATNKQKENTTEKQKAKDRDWHKIYDCGHSTWEYDIKEI